jgi:hypothetical protein
MEREREREREREGICEILYSSTTWVRVTVARHMGVEVTEALTLL